jgi:glycosyltransferase involved in cell wall biosynthesis
MRVLSVVFTLDPLGGGVPSGTTNMLLSTQGVGISNTIVSAGSDAARGRASVTAGRLRAGGVEVHQFPAVRGPREVPDRWGLSLRKVGWIARHAGEYDVIHIHGVWGLGPLVALIAGRRAGVPIVLTPHESLSTFDIQQSRSRARRRQKMMLKRLYLRWADRFVVQSELEAAESTPPAERDRVSVIPYPIPAAAGDTEQPRRGSRRELRLGFLGRIDRKKNLAVLLDAMAMLPAHVSLDVAGDGHGELPDLMRKRAADLGLQSRVEWRGFIGGEARDRFLDDLDLLVMPSEFESFGMSAAEAMARGLPVVVTERMGVAELIKRHGGGVVTTPSAAAIAAAIMGLDEDRDALRALAEQSSAAPAGECGFDRVGNALQEAYVHARDVSSRSPK